MAFLGVDLQIESCDPKTQFWALLKILKMNGWSESPCISLDMKSNEDLSRHFFLFFVFKWKLAEHNSSHTCRFAKVHELKKLEKGEAKKNCGASKN